MHFQTPDNRDALAVLVVGSVNIDTSFQLPHHVKAGETVKAVASGRSGGGKGANQAMAAAQLGARTGLLAAVGTDAGAALDELTRADVELRSVYVHDTVPTGTATLLITPDNNSIVVDPGANEQLRPEHVSEFDAVNPAPHVVVLQHEVPEDVVETSVRTWSNRATVILNPSPYRPVPLPTLSAVDLVVVNQIELGQLLNEPQPTTTDQAAELLSASSLDSVVVTLGADGVLVLHDGQIRHLSGHVVEVRDTVGAGDAFLGALAAGLANNEGLLQSCRRAVAAGSLAVTVRGARNPTLTIDAVDLLLASSRGGSEVESCQSTSAVESAPDTRL